MINAYKLDNLDCANCAAKVNYPGMNSWAC